MIRKMASFLTRKNQGVSLLVPVLLSLFLFFVYNNLRKSMPKPEYTQSQSQNQFHKEAETGMGTAIEIPGVKIERNPSESKLTDLGVTSWPKWGCSPSKFPWTFTAKETMYLLEGKVKVYCDGYDGFFEIGAGDLVEFPKGMKVTWDVTEALNKHYSLEK